MSVCIVGAMAGALVSASVQYATTGKVDGTQVAIAAAVGFVTGRASTLIAANVALAGARVAANVAVGATVGGAHAAASHYAATGTAPSVALLQQEQRLAQRRSDSRNWSSCW